MMTVRERDRKTNHGEEREESMCENDSTRQTLGIKYSPAGHHEKIYLH